MIFRIWLEGCGGKCPYSKFAMRGGAQTHPLLTSLQDRASRASRAILFWLHLKFDAKNSF
ncbi:hypothetical protein BBW65_03290 [Helicobacter enhydrae]|uniref:Uncharacterized protein n=1 Tax=Helicobacter enhydrae TaxID=222136 RepID=A0A1B1U5A9_9HELI|nr:hypothetical protein BBW65_03290 [Helicobacter enhydrae]